MNRGLLQQALPLLIAYQDYTGDSRIANECGEVIEALKAELAAARELKALKPVLYQMRMKADWVENWTEWKDCSEGVADDYTNTPRLNDWSFEVRKLYALEQSE